MTVLGSWQATLVAATMLHLGFQLTITMVTYPALADVTPDRWATAHDAHSRRITPVVVVVYAALLGAVIWALWVDARPGVVVAAVGAGIAMGATAARAAPLHGRLGKGHDPALVGSLIRWDRVRLAGALMAVLGALVSWSGG